MFVILNDLYALKHEEYEKYQPLSMNDPHLPLPYDSLYTVSDIENLICLRKVIDFKDPPNESIRGVTILPGSKEQNREVIS